MRIDKKCRLCTLHNVILMRGTVAMLKRSSPRLGKAERIATPRQAKD